MVGLAGSGPLFASTGSFTVMLLRNTEPPVNVLGRSAGASTGIEIVIDVSSDGPRWQRTSAPVTVQRLSHDALAGLAAS